MLLRTKMLIEKSAKAKTPILAVFLLSTIALSWGQSCEGDPCMYGICLENTNSTYSCYCIDGYTGINCEINWDDCWSNPCLNGGTCNDAVAAYNCTCAEGFAGIHCEQRYSVCSNQPCLNNGTCLDYDGITCQCPDGYSGDYCEIDASVCNDTICKNGAECEEGPGFSFFCRCPEGWTGQLCEEDVDECVTSPCKNGGLCINIPASYTCACLFGYTGKDCDKTVVPCDENPCKNDAICLFEDERPVCYCVPDYHGVLCEMKYDDCVSKFANCENGGTCIDGINSFTCVCPLYYSGRFCNHYDFPSSTTFPSTEETFETDIHKEITAFTSTLPPSSSSSSSSPLSSTVQETDVSMSATISPAVQSSTSYKSSTHFDTKWYPFSETMSSTLNEDFFSSSSTTSGSSSSDSSSTQETSQFVTDITSMDSLTSKEISQTETVTLDALTYPSVSTSDDSSFTTTTNVEATQKSIYNETTSPDIAYHEDAGRAFTSSEAGTIIEYFTETGYSPTTTTPIEKVTEDFTTIESEKDGSPRSSITPSTSFIEFWQNKSTESSTPMMEMTKTTSHSVTDNDWTTTQIPMFASTEMENSTFTVSNNVSSSVTSTGPMIGDSTTDSKDEEFSTRTETPSTTKVSPTDTDCHGILCPSFTVSPARNDSGCNCTQRENCKTGPSITRAAFNGKSYARQHASVEVSNGNNATLRILIRLRTRFKDGIVLHVYFDNEKYALVYLEYGSLKFQFSCGLETMLLGEIDSPINNGYEAEIDTRFQYLMRNETNKCSARLLVNGTTAVSGEQILPVRGSLPQHANVHIGGIPVIFSHYFSHITMGFTGCMDSLRINDVPRHFIHDSIETFQIEDCVSFMCLSSPCQNFGACEEVNGTVRCRCIAGYTGPFCERSTCDENPCALGATCISSPGTGFVCVCPLGTHGLLCEEDTNINRPSFSVLVPGFSSYIAYGVSNSIRDTMELRLKLIPRTYEQISLIAYLGQSGSRRDLSDHLSITYVRGYIMLTWDLGAGVRRIFANAPLNTATKIAASSKTYVAYTVHVGRRGADAWLSVDGIGNVTGRVPGSMTRLDVSPILYIGGHKSKNFESLPHDLPLHTGFSGCIFDVELRTESATYPITSSSPATGRGVGECHRNECIRHLCKNGAVCLNHGATYSCVCTKEWMGSDCSIPVEASSVDSSSCHTP